MPAEPAKAEVLSWLWADPNRTARDAVRQWWGDLDDAAVVTKASLVRMWASRARRAVDRDDEEDEDERPATPASEDRITWLRDQVAALAGDIEIARRKKQWPAVAALTRVSSDVRAELDQAIRVPPPAAPTEPVRPIFSDEALATMTPGQLGAVIRALGSFTSDPLNIEAAAAAAAAFEEDAEAIAARATELVRERRERVATKLADSGGPTHVYAARCAEEANQNATLSEDEPDEDEDEPAASNGITWVRRTG